jgi:Ni,Fe-hydrogenase I large subunit
VIIQSQPKAGQLEKELDIELFVNRNRVVQEARFHSSIYQGEKGVLHGRPAREAGRVTAHIFGFCGGSHQQAAAMALEHAWKAKVPADAQLLRSVALATEIIQNATRWMYTTYAPDLTNTCFADSPFYQDIVDRFTAFKGVSFRKGMLAGAQPMALYALIAGQWPHSDFAVPGGVQTSFDASKLPQALAILDRFRDEWLEPTLLGCTVDEFLALQDYHQLLNWLDQNDTQSRSDLALLLRASLDYGLDKMGHSNGRLLTYGAFWGGDADLSMSPETHGVVADVPALYQEPGKFERFRYKEILYQLQEGESSFINYHGVVVEVGPLDRMSALAYKAEAEEGHTEIPVLVADIIRQQGPGVLSRAFARIYEIVFLYKKIREWLSRLSFSGEWLFPVEEKDGWGLGLTEAPRGALAHYLEVKDGQIIDYQILAPTLLNIQSGSSQRKGPPLAAAMEDISLKDLEMPIEAGIIARSFDACLVCNVDLYKSSSGKPIGKARV